MERPEKKLTARQAAVLDFIIDHIQDTGFPPTIREIGDHLGISSTNGVNDHLKALERKGYLVREDAKSRALRPIFTPDREPFDPHGTSDHPQVLDDVHSIPIVGRIAAGAPITAIENVEEEVSMGESLLGRPSDVFGLVVSGDSMIEDGIFNGDYIFVKKQADARNNEIVAAMVDGEATVKRFFRESNGVIRLQPANEAMEPIYVTADQARDTQILGKVIAVFRRI
jgi:repressor LexA